MPIRAQHLFLYPIDWAQLRSRVIIDDLRRVLDMRLGQISCKGGLAEAIRYTLSTGTASAASSTTDVSN